MNKALTLEQVSDIIFICTYRKLLPEDVRPYFDWWVDYCAVNGVPITYGRMDDHVL